LKKRTFWILAGGLVAVALGAAAVGVVALMFSAGSSGSWGGKRYLAVHLGDQIPDQPPPDLGPLFGGTRPTLSTLVASIDRAAADPNVSGISVRVTPLADSGWGKVQELRAALQRFRQTGKPAYAHLAYAGNLEYYLATACTKIYALPTAIVNVSGLAAEVTFFRETLDKVGVEAQFEGVGKYKNAPNQYTETTFTEPHREQMDALLDSLHGQFVAAVAEGRGLTPEQVQAAVDGGPYDAQEALERGLVDELLYDDEVDAQLEADASRTTPGRYLRGGRGFQLGGYPRIAVVYAVGEIVPGGSDSGLFGTYAGADTVSDALEQAAGDDDVRGILFRVDSPGGVGSAADAIWRAVSVARRSKPVVVWMGDAAASGGYYVAMAGDAIVAQPGTITGSIGVFSGKFSLRGLYDKIGLHKEILTRGRHAALFSDYRPWDESERERIRSMNEAFYRDFVTKAAEARGMSFEELDAVAQGRVWTGEDARERGLVDQLGGFKEALGVLREKAGLGATQPVELVVVPEPKGLFELLFAQPEETSIAAALPAELRTALGWMSFFGDGVPIARIPYGLRLR